MSIRAFLREGEVFSPLSMGYIVFEVWLRRIRRLECWVCPHPLPTPWKWWTAWISRDSIARVVFPASHCSYRAFSSLLQVFAFSDQDPQHFCPTLFVSLPISFCLPPTPYSARTIECVLKNVLNREYRVTLESLTIFTWFILISSLGDSHCSVHFISLHCEYGWRNLQNRAE